MRNIANLMRHIVVRNWPEAKYDLCSIWDNVCYPFYKVKRFISNLYDYLPIIWNDFNFDYYYLLKLMDFKLKKMESVLEKHDGDNKISAQEIRDALKILDRILKDGYESEIMKDHDEKWGEIEMEFHPTEDGYSTLEINRKNVLSKEDKEIEIAEFMARMDQADQNKKQDIKKFFQILSDKIQGWWC